MSVIPSDLVVYSSLGVSAYDGASTLSAAITSGATSIPYGATASISGFPPVASYPYEFPVLVGSEILWVTQGTSGTASGTFTAIRGFANTTAASAVSGAAITMLSGGPVDFLSRVSFTDLSVADFVDTVSSSGADLAAVSVTARNPGGTIVYNQIGVLNNTTAVTGIGAQTYERLLAVSVGPTTTLTAAVTSVTMTTLTTVASAAQTVPFFAMMGREVVNVTGGATGTAWVMTRGQLGTTATLHNSGDRIFAMPKGDVAVYSHTAIVTGTCTAASSGGTGTTPPLIAMQAGQGSSAAIGTVIRTTGGTGPNQIRYVVANSGYGTDVVAVNRDLSPALSNTTTYTVNNGYVLETVTSAGTGATVANQVTNIQRAFWNDSADVPGGSNRNYYQKCFQVNNNTVTDFTAASIMVFSDTPVLPPGATLSFALTTGAADTLSVLNRQTAPATGSITAYVSVTGSAINVVANSGGLLHGTAPNSGAAQGIWLNLSLVSGTAAYKGAADIRVQGVTT
jgi:hypothetical protein